MTFYDFLIRHFKKNVKSHVFWKSEKNEKYAFSNTGVELMGEDLPCYSNKIEPVMV